MNRLRALLAQARKNKTAIVASVLSGGEIFVQAGGALPGSDAIPKSLRLALIALLTMLAFYYRWKAGMEASGAR